MPFCSLLWMLDRTVDSVFFRYSELSAFPPRHRLPNTQLDARNHHNEPMSDSSSSSSPSPGPEGAPGSLELLSVWNQISPRVYITVVLCFPLKNSAVGDTLQHLRHSLDRLARVRPLFASRLRAACAGEPGLAQLDQSPDYEIPFEYTFEPRDIPNNYQELKAKGFPPGLFIHPQFGIPGIIDRDTDPLPVCRVHALVIRGGLLLALNLHHSLCDGSSLRVFLECFAAETRGDAIDRPSEQAFETPKSGRQSKSNFRSLVSRCPEYAVLPQRSGPTQPLFSARGTPIDCIKRTGKIFVFKKGRIAELQSAIRASLGVEKAPSTYTCLAALAFAHITKARLQTDNFLPDSEVEGKKAQLWNSVNWRSRAFQSQTGDYFGNAALPAVAKISRERLVRACEDVGTLAKLIPSIKKSIDAVDENYVHQRLAMVSATPDPRLIGVNYDPRMPHCLAFNTWRHFGADAVWNIPGVLSKKPEAIRRAHGACNLGTALILPGRIASDAQELFVSLSQESMGLLCKDREWLRWVDRVIG